MKKQWKNGCGTPRLTEWSSVGAARNFWFSPLISTAFSQRNVSAPLILCKGAKMLLKFPNPCYNNAYWTKPQALKFMRFKAHWLCSCARILGRISQNPCTLHWRIVIRQWKYALLQWLNFIKTIKKAVFMKLRGRSRANKPQSGLFSRHYNICVESFARKERTRYGTSHSLSHHSLL